MGYDADRLALLPPSLHLINMKSSAIPYLLDSKLLRCFLAVMEYRNVTAASEALCLTQSATSKSILKLEEELGVTLFERNSSGMTPTIYGLTLARRANQISLESRHARNEIDALKSGGYGTLNVGAGPMWSVCMLPQAISALHHQRPGVRIHSSTGVIDTMVPQLLKGELDLICVSLDFPDHPEIVKEYLLDVEYVIVAGKDHALCQKHTVSPEDLLDYAWAGLANDYVALNRINQFFTSHGMEPPKPTVETSSLGALLSIVRTGEFLAGISAPILPHAHEMGLVRVELDANFWRFKAGVAFRRDHTPLIAQELVQALREIVDQRPTLVPDAESRHCANIDSAIVQSQ